MLLPQFWDEFFYRTPSRLPHDVRDKEHFHAAKLLPKWGNLQAPSSNSDSSRRESACRMLTPRMVRISIRWLCLGLPGECVRAASRAQCRDCEIIHKFNLPRFFVLLGWFCEAQPGFA